MTGSTESQGAMPGATTALVFANMGIVASFMGHLVSMAVVLSALALVLVAYGRFKARGAAAAYSKSSVARSQWAFRLGLIGLALGIVMWLLWRTAVLPIL